VSLTRALRLTLFQILRAEAASLRARFASRFASFTRLRARFNSSFAIRTRCLATSACSRARSTGSADACASDEFDPVDASALPVFFIRCPVAQALRRQSHICGKPMPPRSTPVLQRKRLPYPQILCIRLWTGELGRAKGATQATTCVKLLDLSPTAAEALSSSRGNSRAASWQLPCCVRCSYCGIGPHLRPSAVGPGFFSRSRVLGRDRRGRSSP